MKRTDYGTTAAQYDANVAPHRIPKDAALADKVATSTGPIDALDVACGTDRRRVGARRSARDASLI